MKRIGAISILFVLLFIALFLDGGTFSASLRAKETALSKPVLKVLFISPFNISFLQDFQTTAGFLARLNESGSSYVLKRFDMCLHNGHCTPEKQAEFAEVAKEILAGEYRIVVCFGVPSADLLKNNVPVVPNSVSVLVCGISSLDQNQIPPDYGGVVQNIDISNHFRLIRRLFPEKKKILLLTNWHQTGRRVSAIAREAIEEFPDMELREIDNKAVSTEQMIKQVHSLGSGYVVLFQGWYNKNAVNASSLQNLMDNLGGRPEAPLFVMHSAMLSYGTVGGCIEDGTETGRMTAELALEILSGNATPKIRQLPARTVLNEPMLRFYRVSEDSLPRNAQIYGRDESFFARHRLKIVICTAVFFLILALAVVCLILAVRFRRLNRRLTAVFEHLPINVAVVGQRENILLHYGKSDIPGVGYNIRKVKDLSLDVYEKLKNIMEDVLRTGVLWNGEYLKDGLHRRGLCVPLPKRTFGQPTVLWTSLEIEELVRLTENEKLLNRCLALAMAQSDTEATFANILKTICRHFDGDQSCILRFSPETRTYEVVEEYKADGSPISPPPACPEVVAARLLGLPNEQRPIVAYDAAEKETAEGPDGGRWKDYMTELHIQKLYVMPIFLKGEQWGHWSVSFKKENVALPNQSLQLMASIGSMLELVLMRQTYIADLANALDQAQTATRAKSVFLSTMGHELRTPLNAIIGFSELLSEADVSGEEQREYLSGINLSGKLLYSLINDVLDFSKLESDRMEIVVVPTDLVQMFRELKVMFRQPCAAKGIAFDCPIRADMPLLGLDELRIRQILMNLVGNAVKFTQNGSVRLSAEYTDDAALKLVVKDTGIGINPSAQEGIFEPFVQQDSLRDTKVFKGTGLGLAIVKRLVEKMRGRIELTSEVGKGSTFSVLLPSIESFERSPEPAAQSGGEQSERKIGRPLSVLLVDDIPLNLTVMEAMMAKLNVSNVLKTTSAEEALRKLKENPVDLVFTDMWMPGMNGLELSRAIHADRSLSRVKIILLTADAETIEMKDGFDAVMMKPFTKAKLFNLLREFSPNDAN